MNKHNIVDKLTDRRRELKISQRELAKRCNMPQSTIARIETHQISPQLETISLIAEKLNCNIQLEDKLKSKWDGCKISVFWKDELTALVSISNNQVFIKRFTDNPIKQFFLAFDKIDIPKLSELLETRCWEKGRCDIYELLNKIGLDHYDPIEIVKRTFGVSYNDCIWFKFGNNNITWSKICPKGEKYV
ncbi:MAG: helix-turn-helix domain-containing protein [Ruminococcus sp.]